MMEKPRILAIIVTWNKKEYVLKLLKALRDLDYPADRLDVVVVDNASTDGTPEAVREGFPEVHLIVNDKNLGGSGGFNTGLSYAYSLPRGTYKYLWLLDNDVLPHREALSWMVRTLEENPVYGACGSVMMQLDFPWRINEIGAFFSYSTGELRLNYHLLEIPSLVGKDVAELIKSRIDLSQYITNLPDVVEVGYSAAASLLVRDDVARRIGLFKDFFIHYDDVEWCLRMRKEGYPVVVSTRSIIWHLSGITKIPTWVLYYDNRNALEVVRLHGTGADLKSVWKRFLKKPLYYTLIGKQDLANIIEEGLMDYLKGCFGRKEIKLPWKYASIEALEEEIEKRKIKKILISPTVNTWTTGLNKVLNSVLRKHKDVTITVIEGPWQQFQEQTIIKYPVRKILRAVWNLKNYKKYDLFIQSDYQPLMLLPFTAKYTLCVNDYNASLRPSPQLSDVSRYIKFYLEFSRKNGMPTPA